MIKIYWFAFLLFAVTFSALSQTPKNRVISIPVERNGALMREPWTGGMNSPQFSPGDLNGDGIKDLFVFDRVGNKALTFINRGNGSDTTFYYSPKYEELIPEDLNNWAMLRDYNNDGIVDIFSYQGTRIKVYKGSYANGQLHFDLVAPELMYEDGPVTTSIWTNIDDIPIITDVNRDGDMDILTYGTFGATIGYYENQTVENAGNPLYAYDSLKYKSISLCWGNFSENANNDITMNISCKGAGLAEPLNDESRDEGARDGAHSIFAIDPDNDGAVDILMGNLNYYKMFMLKNCGNNLSANICSYDSAFPSCDVPVNMQTGPSGYGIDANNDGLEDLLIAPNARLGSRDVRNVMLYKNVNNPACNYQYQNDSFLVHHSLDFGTDSKASFFDFTGDGLMDIVVGNYGYFRTFQPYKSVFALYENIGTATQPKFRLLTDNYNDFDTSNIIGFHPAFGDLDGDGKADMVAGEQNGYIHFFKNMAATGASYPVITTRQYFGLDASQYSAPFIYDVNGDSLNDLVVGRRDGRLNYYWNFGTKNSPLFHSDSVILNFGKVNVTFSGQTDGLSAPFLKKDSAGNLLLFVGCNRGTISEYLVDVANLSNGTFPLLDADFLKYDVGAKSTISIADINNDGKMEYLVGNARGGLLLYSDSVWDPGTSLAINELPVNPVNPLHVFPNPAKGYFICSVAGGGFQSPAIEIFNMLGEKVVTENSVAANNIRVNTLQLGQGIYFIRIIDKGKVYTAKVLVTK